MNELYTSSILRSPLLAGYIASSTAVRGINRDIIFSCIDDEVEAARDFSLQAGEAHMPSEFGTSIRRNDKLTGLGLGMLNGSANPKENYSYWIAGHSDCKYVNGVISGIFLRQAQISAMLKAIYGQDAAELIVDVVKESELPAAELAVAVSGLITLISGYNLVEYDVVKRHRDEYGAAIVPALQLFTRGDISPNGFPQKELYIYSPQDNAFEKAGSPAWVEKIEKRGDYMSGSASHALRGAIDSFAERIAKSDCNLLIRT